ncbi:unnamed protein product [Pleuronectes platessa]|uniref:Uncharacterized protein n=1 Tax=Pleuronectes platessa TaxID=8262 RepID=A0A9N7YSE3_PLEPL|nr:unnamed protein product [Pleuronectes platessa]
MFRTGTAVDLKIWRDPSQRAYVCGVMSSSRSRVGSRSCRSPAPPLCPLIRSGTFSAPRTRRLTGILPPHPRADADVLELGLHGESVLVVQQ